MVFWAGIMEKVVFNRICATKQVQFNSLRKAIKAECNTNAKFKGYALTQISIYALSDLGNSSNLIGSLSRTMTFSKVQVVVY